MFEKHRGRASLWRRLLVHNAVHGSRLVGRRSRQPRSAGSSAGCEASSTRSTARVFATAGRPETLVLDFCLASVLRAASSRRLTLALGRARASSSGIRRYRAALDDTRAQNDFIQSARRPVAGICVSALVFQTSNARSVQAWLPRNERPTHQRRPPKSRGAKARRPRNGGRDKGHLADIEPLAKEALAEIGDGPKKAADVARKINEILAQAAREIVRSH